MNANRRKRIAEVVALLEAIDLGPIQDAIDSLREEEQEAFDNMPEGLQQSERGQATEEAVGHLDEALSAIEDAVSQIECTVNELNEASGS